MTTASVSLAADWPWFLFSYLLGVVIGYLGRTQREA